MQDFSVPLVSVIIPTYRRSDYLLRAVESALDQTHSNVEVIVVNDNDLGTNDYDYVTTILDALKDCRLKIISNYGNRGGGYARNNGFNHSQGEFIAFLDDDDVFYPQKIWAQINYLKKHSEFDGCYTGNEYSYPNKTKKYIKSIEGDITIPLVELKTRTAAGSSLMVTRQSYLLTGGFNVELKRYQDWDFMLRFLKNFKLGCVSSVLVRVDMSSRINVGTCEQVVNNKFVFIDLLNQYIPENIRHRIYYLHLLDLSIQLLRLGCYKRSFSYLISGRKALAFYPKMGIRYFYHLVKCII